MKKSKFWKSVLILLGIFVLILVASHIIYIFNGLQICASKTNDILLFLYFAGSIFA